MNPISRVGETLVCLPNRFVVEIKREMLQTITDTIDSQTF